MGESAGKEIANLYTRGVNQGYEGHPLEAQYLLDLLDVFGEVGVRMYLVGILEREEDAEDQEAATDPDAVEAIVDYENRRSNPHRTYGRGRGRPLDDSD